ncbi:MAG: hypothetical protein K1X88_08260 [Nannocystaceae bacterium]|nr:hypothetical protein [Nannocystaceae bacterium]
MSPRLRTLALVGATLGGGACFDGDATVGAVCSQASDCGPHQGCRHELCGRCGDGAHAEGELCFADAVAVTDVPAVASVRAVDLDGDGRGELLSLGPDGGLSWLRPHGGSLVAMPLHPGPVAASADGAIAGDDGRDLVLAASPGLLVLEQRDDAFVGVQTLTLPLPAVEVAIVPLAQGVALAWVDEAGSAWLQLPGDDAVPQALSVGTAVHLGPVGRFDDDAHDDLAVVDTRANRVQLLHGDGTTLVPGATLTVGRGPVAAIGWDRTGDGRTDLLTLDVTGRTVTMVDVGAGGALSSPGALALAAAPTGAVAIDGDFDGVLDVFVGSVRGITVWRAAGSETLDAVHLDTRAVDGLTHARFGPLPLPTLLAVRGAMLERIEVDP